MGIGVNVKYSHHDRYQQKRIFAEAPRTTQLLFEAAVRAGNRGRAQDLWNDMRRSFFGGR